MQADESSVTMRLKQQSTILNLPNSDKLPLPEAENTLTRVTNALFLQLNSIFYRSPQKSQKPVLHLRQPKSMIAVADDYSDVDPVSTSLTHMNNYLSAEEFSQSSSWKKRQVRPVLFRSSTLRLFVEERIPGRVI